jgi:hypothetical protein
MTSARYYSYYAGLNISKYMSHNTLIQVILLLFLLATVKRKNKMI